MSDLISRQAAIDALRGYLVEKRCPDDGTLTCRLIENEVINKLPSAEPKRGHWIEADVCGNTTSWECSCCHNWTGLPTGWNVKAKLWFCPKCTADMRTKETKTSHRVSATSTCGKGREER